MTLRARFRFPRVAAPKRRDPPFAGMVRRRMEERGLGLREFCRAVELDPSFFSKVLAGKRSAPSEDEVLRRIAAFLELDPCELIVAAGRIPKEWDRLWTDRLLLVAVGKMCSKTVPARATARSAHGKERYDRTLAVIPAPGRPLGDELL